MRFPYKGSCFCSFSSPLASLLTEPSLHKALKNVCPFLIHTLNPEHLKGVLLPVVWTNPSEPFKRLDIFSRLLGGWVIKKAEEKKKSTKKIRRTNWGTEAFIILQIRSVKIIYAQTVISKKVLAFSCLVKAVSGHDIMHIPQSSVINVTQIYLYIFMSLL